MRSGPILGLLLCLAALPAQARTHLDPNELRILSASSVAVVYVGTDTALEHGLDPAHHTLGVTPLTAVLADVLNSYRLHMLLAHIAPYQGALDKLALPESMRKSVQDALVSVPWLAQTPWAEARQDPSDRLFLTEHAQRAKASVVIFIQPHLFLDPDADALYMVCSIDIETAGPGGRGVSHYDSSDVVVSEPVTDTGLPVPDQSHDLGDLRMARLFADDAAAFKQLYAKLMLQSQQQLYYYFTGKPSPQPVPATRAGQ
jgi:hypothetical protein